MTEDKKRQTNESRIRKVTLAGLFANVILSVVKLVIGLAGNSQAVVADALHSFSDTSSDVVILFGVKYWSAPADECHPFGHQKIESFVTIGIGLILIGVAAGIGYNAIIALMVQDQQPAISWITFTAPLLSLVVKEVLFKITYRVGVETHSSSVKANAWHHRTDALSSLPVLVAVTASLINPGLAFLDQVGAIIVSVFIIKVGLDILISSIGELLDTSMSRRDIETVKQTITNTPGVLGVHKIRTRKLAGSFYMDLHLEVDGALTVAKGHDISEKVKDVLIRKNDRIIDVMVHLEPYPQHVAME
ncbi:MAG TPA: cation-efflux pump [Desulfobacteraceae bacterium]|nr:cation-efflux pump [Desulfobacteraceae bacterium]|tara:strand:- start:1044 stop:1955 length:912 start_codon:yes stop_codon:yes gene_type:complete